VRLLAAAAVTAATLGASQLPAWAAPAASPVIRIRVAAPFHLNGIKFVVYRSHRADGQVFGTVAGAVGGEVVRLYARQFPYNKPFTQVGNPITLHGSGTIPYSFKVFPALATRYRTEVFADSTATAPLASSSVKIIYVVKNMVITESHTCPRPNCKSKVHVKVFLPAQAMRTERAKKIYTYFAVNLSPSRIPPPPKVLRRGAGHPRVTRTSKVSAGEYTFRITFTFRIGNNAARWSFNFCTKDAVAKDGLGLPGHHQCGNAKIRAGINYLG
jgi:hypothetical protein